MHCLKAFVELFKNGEGSNIANALEMGVAVEEAEKVFFNGHGECLFVEYCKHGLRVSESGEC